jgi:hypothetical protein
MLPVVTALVAVPPQQVTFLKLARASDRMVLRAGRLGILRQAGGPT